MRVAKNNDLEVFLGIFQIGHFWVVIEFGENFTVRARKFRCMISTKRLRIKDDLEASHKILQIDNLLGRNCVK